MIRWLNYFIMPYIMSCLSPRDLTHRAYFTYSEPSEEFDKKYILYCWIQWWILLWSMWYLSALLIYLRVQGCIFHHDCRPIIRIFPPSTSLKKNLTFPFHWLPLLSHLILPSKPLSLSLSQKCPSHTGWQVFLSCIKHIHVGSTFLVWTVQVIAPPCLLVVGCALLQRKWYKMSDWSTNQ